MARLTQQEISERTGFDQGDVFTSREQVLDYFTVQEQHRMFGHDAISDGGLLRAMAEKVIENRWHYEPLIDRSELSEELRRCIADAEEALNSAAILAARVGLTQVREACLSARSRLRIALGEGAH